MSVPTKKWVETADTSSVSPYTSFVLSPLRACFTPEHCSTVKATLLFDGVVWKYAAHPIGFKKVCDRRTY